MMKDYEKVFTDNLFIGLRDKVRGKVTAYVFNDELYVKIENGDFKYNRIYTDFAEQIYNGLNSQYIIYDVCKEYRRLVNKTYFK